MTWNYYCRKMDESSKNNLELYLISADSAFKIAKLYPPQYEKQVKMLNDIGNVCSDNRNYDNAKKVYEEAKLICELYIGRDSDSYIQTLLNSGVMYMRINNFIAAEKYLGEARVLCLKLYGENSPNNEGILFNCAIVNALQSKDEDARTLFNKSIKISDINGDYYMGNTICKEYARYLGEQPYSTEIAKEFLKLVYRFRTDIRLHLTDEACYVMNKFSLYNVNKDKINALMFAEEMNFISMKIHQNNDEKRCEVLYNYAVICEKMHKQKLLNDVVIQIREMVKKNDKLKKYKVNIDNLLLVDFKKSSAVI